MKWFTEQPWLSDMSTLEYLSNNGDVLAKSLLLKSNRAVREGLVQVERMVSKPGITPFQQKFWVKPDQVQKTDIVLRGHQNLPQNHPQKHPKVNYYTKYKAVSPNVQKFKNSGEAHEILGDPDDYENPNQNTTYINWVKNLTDQELTAIDYYTGAGYSDINKLLRGQITSFKYGRTKTKEIMQHIDSMDIAIEKSTLKQDIVVYRLMEFAKKEEIDKFKSGIYQDNGFVSTAVIPGSFSGIDTYDIPYNKDDMFDKEHNSPEPTTSRTNIYIRIRVPKGKGVGMWVDPISELEEEEFILARGSQFKVHKIQVDETGTYLVEMELIGRHVQDYESIIKSMQPSNSKNYNKFTWSLGDLIKLG